MVRPPVMRLPTGSAAIMATQQASSPSGSWAMG